MNKKIIGISLLLVFMAMTVFLQACQDKPLDFEVLSLDITPSKVVTGEKATIKVEIRNNNAEDVSYNVPLMVDGVADDRKSVTLAPGAAELITFTLTRNHPGTYRISVGSSESTLVVEKLMPPEFHLYNLDINPTEVDIGEAVVITAKIANVGGTQSSYTAELKVDDCTIQTEKVTLAAGADTTLSFKICADLPGTYEVTLGELTGKFIVAQPVIPIQNTNTSPASNPNSCSARG